LGFPNCFGHKSESQGLFHEKDIRGLSLFVPIMSGGFTLSEPKEAI
jgi:hypothetical protein